MSIPLFPEKSPQPVQSSQERAFCVAYVDGGARGNPGPSGFGVVIQDAMGRRVAELSEYLGKQTNNYAEYSGLLAALKYALQHDIRALKVISDSELMVKQIKGQYKVNSPTLKELYLDATRLIRQLESFQISHVLREKNRKADELANRAMDRGTGKAVSSRAMADGMPAAAPEVNGVVKDGAVQFLGDSFPEGTLVKVRAVRR